MITLPRLKELLAEFPKLTIGLVGDLFLDRYLEIEPGVHEVSIETGLEAYQISRVRNAPGALGTVMNNLAALDVGRLRPVTVIGDDGHGRDLLAALRALPVDSEWIVTDPLRMTPTYTKPMRQNAQRKWDELSRLDFRSRCPLSPGAEKKLIQHIREVFENSDGLIVLDQIMEDNWGVINELVRNTIDVLAVEQPEKLIFVDSRNHLDRFSHGILKGNQRELLAAAKMPETAAPDAVRLAAAAIASRSQRPVFGTLGAQGILVSFPDGRQSISPGFPSRGPVDIVGAGDSATSGMVASLLSGADEIEAASVGNLVASITVQQIGTTGTATPEQVLRRFRDVCAEG